MNLWYETLPYSLIQRLRVANNKDNLLDRKKFLEGILYLDFSNLRLAEVPSLIKQMPNLAYVDLSRNNISGVIETSLFPPSITSIDLSYNEIEQFKHNQDLENLETLFLANNRIEEFPRVDVFPSLEELSLGGNKISEIPSDVEFPESLVKLEMSYNLLEDVHIRKGHLKNILTLDLSNNKIVNFPRGLIRGTNLTYLDLRGNLIGDWESYSTMRKSIIVQV